MAGDSIAETNWQSPASADALETNGGISMGAQLESGNGAASIEAREDEFLGNLELLDDTLLQFEYILSFIGDLNAISEEDRTDDCKVEGCASNAWLMLEARNGRLKLSLGSDSLIIEGLLGALTWMLDAQPLEDVAAWQPRFLKHPQMKPHLNSDRSHGIASIVKAIQAFCEVESGEAARSGCSPATT